jgi:hypothetical protein
MTAFILRGEKIEISCANGGELRDNDFNFGGLAIWDGIGRMDGNDQFEAEAIAAVSQAEYFALQRLPNGALYGPPIRCYTDSITKCWAVLRSLSKRKKFGDS